MATLTVRRLDDGVYERLAQRAKRNNRSLEAEARQILSEQAPSEDIQELVADLREFRQRTRLKLEAGQDSVSLIRAIRDEE